MWAAPWIVRLARLGFASIGFTYAVLGVFALRAALTGYDLPKNFRGAFVQLGSAWPGQLLLGALALGFGGFAVWQALWAVFDAEGEGRGWLALLRRGGALVNGVIYSGLAWLAASVALGEWGSGESNAELWTGRFLSLFAGRWLVAAGGAVALALALNQLYVAWRKLFLAGIEQGRLHPLGLAVTTQLGRYGLIARAVIIVTVGVFLGLAGYTGDVQEAGGLRQALTTLGTLPLGPLGPWLLAVVALGLIALGAFSVLQAIYRRVPVALGEWEDAVVD